MRLGQLRGMPGESTSASSRPGTSDGHVIVKPSASAAARLGADRPRQIVPRPSRAAPAPPAARPAQAEYGEKLPREDRREDVIVIFKVASPTSAKIIATIQKRITIVGSAQPIFSK